MIRNRRTLLAILALLSCACGRAGRPVQAERHYLLSGKVTALDSQHQTATVDAAAIPNFMEAMAMEYPVASKQEFQTLKVGEQITATVDVTSDGSYTLSKVKPGSK